MPDSVMAPTMFGTEAGAGHGNGTPVDPLTPLRSHPAFGVADLLAADTGLDRDLLQFVEFLSLAAGRMVMPVNLDVQTDRVAIDLYVANRVLDLRHEHVARVDTHREFRTLEQEGFCLPGSPTASYVVGPPPSYRPVAAVLIRGHQRNLHRKVSENTARVLGSDFTLPSLWRVVGRLERLLGLRYHAEVDRPGDGTATVLVHWELESLEAVEALVWRLIKRVYKPRLLLDEEVGRLRALHDVLPPPDVSQEMARREEEERRTGLRMISHLTAKAADVYPVCPDCLSGDDFDPETGEPPLMRSADLDRRVAEYYPGHQNQAKAFIRSLDELLRRYVRLFMTETGLRWRERSCPGDAACAAFRYFRNVVEDALCHPRRAG